MKKILAIGIIALLALGVGLGVVSGLTRNEVEPPQPLGIGIDGGDLSVIECIQGQDAVCTARGKLVIRDRSGKLTTSLWITTMMTEYVYGVTT